MLSSKEVLERLGNEKIVVKGNWDGTIGREPQYNHLTTFKEHFKNEYATLLQDLEVLEIIKNKPQVELFSIQSGNIKTYEDYLDRTFIWAFKFWVLRYTEEEFNKIKEWVKQ